MLTAKGMQIVEGCKYETGENGICKKLITRKNIEILTGYLIHELLYFLFAKK